MLDAFDITHFENSSSYLLGKCVGIFSVPHTHSGAMYLLALPCVPGQGWTGQRDSPHYCRYQTRFGLDFVVTVDMDVIHVHHSLAGVPSRNRSLTAVGSWRVDGGCWFRLDASACMYV